jgi:hypothetical protein
MYLETGGKKLSRKNDIVELEQENVYPKGQASLTIGEPDNQRPDKWNSTVSTTSGVKFLIPATCR